MGDRQGHAIQVSSSTCMHEGDVLDGAILTQNTIWEVDKTGALVASNGVARKPGGMAVYQVKVGSVTYLTKDGKPAGWTGAGKGVYTLASGSAASLSGKTFTWTGHSTGPRTYVVESKLD